MDVEMRRSSWIVWVGTKYHHRCLYKRGRGRQTHRNGAAWRQRRDSHPPARVRWCHLRLDLPGASGGGTADTLISGFWLPSST